MMNPIKKSLKKIWRSLLGKSKEPRFSRYQAQFHKLYPSFEIGVCTYGVPVVRLWNKTSLLKIGSYCSISKNAKIFLGGNHRTDWVSSYPFPFFFPEKWGHIKEFDTSRGDVLIGNDVWLCEDCTILSGVTIGHGAVVASNAVVSRDVPPYAIVAGNPAKIVRWRFDETTRAALLEHAWWNWPEEEIQQVIDKLCSTDIEAFLNYARNRKNN